MLITYLLSRLHYKMWLVRSNTLFLLIRNRPYRLQNW